MIKIGKDLRLEQFEKSKKQHHVKIHQHFYAERLKLKIYQRIRPAKLSNVWNIRPL